MKLMAVSLLAAFWLCACGGSQGIDAPQSYTVDQNSLPSLNELVTLEEGYTCKETEEDEEGNVSYVYSKLTDAGQIVESYTQSLEQDYSCTIAAGADSESGLDFTADDGQVLAAQQLEDSEQVFLLTIQWDQDSCTITPSLADQDVLPQEDGQTITFEQAVALVRTTPTSVLRLSGSSMDEYNVLPQDGAVFLNDQPCILLDVYRKDDHQLEQSYLLTAPDLKIYLLNRNSGEAFLLN